MSPTRERLNVFEHSEKQYLRAESKKYVDFSWYGSFVFIIMVSYSFILAQCGQFIIRNKKIELIFLIEVEMFSQNEWIGLE